MEEQSCGSKSVAEVGILHDFVAVILRSFATFLQVGLKILRCTQETKKNASRSEKLISEQKRGPVYGSTKRTKTEDENAATASGQRAGKGSEVGLLKQAKSEDKNLWTA